MPGDEALQAETGCPHRAAAKRMLRIGLEPQLARIIPCCDGDSDRTPALPRRPAFDAIAAKFEPGKRLTAVLAQYSDCSAQLFGIAFVRNQGFGGCGTPCWITPGQHPAIAGEIVGGDRKRGLKIRN